MDEPVDTITSNDHNAVVAAHLQREFGRSVGAELGQPAPTVTPGGAGKSTLVTSHLLKLHGSSVQGDLFAKPAPTIRAGGNHLAEVRAFLIAYYGTDQKTGNLKNPMPTITPVDRFGLVTVHGQDYVIADIGMRMLTPRERFRAQGFSDSYVIDPLFEYVYTNAKTGKVRRVTKPLTQEAQGRMCGNSVCPPLAAAIVASNYTPAIQPAERVA
jgi:DNA (cytosine-5)-methyltransferase 1